MADDELPVCHATEYQFQPRAVWEGGPHDGMAQYESQAITVAWRGGETWAILRGSNWSPSRAWCEQTREWEWEPQPSERGEDFLARTRYSESTALAIAARLVAERTD